MVVLGSNVIPFKTEVTDYNHMMSATLRGMNCLWNFYD